MKIKVLLWMSLMTLMMITACAGGREVPCGGRRMILALKTALEYNPFKTVARPGWNVWEESQGLVLEFYAHGENPMCGHVVGARIVEPSFQEDRWEAWVEPLIGGGRQSPIMKYLGVFDTRVEAEWAVESSLECHR